MPPSTWRTTLGAVLILALFGGALLVLITTAPRSVATGATGDTPMQPTPRSARAATRTITPLPTEEQILARPRAVQAAAYAQHCLPRSTERYPERICALLKHSALAVDEARFAATARAVVPTADPRRTRTPIPTVPSPTPYVLSADDLIIRRIDQGIRGGDEPYSLWSLGTVVGSHGEPYDVLLWTDVFRRNGQRTAILGQTFRGGSDGRYPRDPAMRDREWVIPTNPGLTEIVAVSGQRGVVTLVGEHGYYGRCRIDPDRREELTHP